MQLLKVHRVHFSDVGTLPSEGTGPTAAAGGVGGRGEEKTEVMIEGQLGGCLLAGPHVLARPAQLQLSCSSGPHVVVAWGRHRGRMMGRLRTAPWLETLAMKQDHQKH